MPEVPFFENNDPPWSDRPLDEPTPSPQHDELGDEDILFWEDKEVIESKAVGDTQYTRAYVRGTDQDSVWATRASGQIEDVGSPNGLPASTVFKALTGPDSPTELGEQMQYEEELQNEVPSWDDRETEIDHLLQEYPDQLDMAREDLDNGTIDQAGYDTRINELETFKQQLEDELATYQMERGEVEAQDPVLEQYAAELAADGISAEELAEHDWQPGRDDPDEPALGDDDGPEMDSAADEPAASLPEPDISIDLGDDDGDIDF
jgi:hypothetical protein